MSSTRCRSAQYPRASNDEPRLLDGEAARVRRVGDERPMAFDPPEIGVFAGAMDGVALAATLLFAGAGACAGRAAPAGAADGALAWTATALAR